MLFRRQRNISILMIVKDEDLYLKEHLCYHRLIGIDHYYIYDNGSKVPASETLHRYRKYCTFIDFPGPAKQLEAYNHFIKNFSSETKWVAPIDADEFITLKKDQDLKSFLKKYHDVDCVALNWRCFGDSFYNERPKGLVIENFTRCEDIQNPHIKNIVKTSAWMDCENAHYIGLKPHSVYVDVKRNKISGPFNDHYTIDVAQLNHYVTKSRDECYEKYKKGRASTVEAFPLTDEMVEAWRTTLNLAEDDFLRNNFSEDVKLMLNKR